MSRSERLTQYLEGTGLEVREWSPGDGVTRYRFVYGKEGYFESCSHLTVLGLASARKVAQGILLGFEQGAKK